MEWEKVTLFFFNGDFSKKWIPIISDTTLIELTNGTIINHMNMTPLLHGGSNSLIYAPQSCVFSVVVYDVAWHNGGSWYIHAIDWVIPMKFYKYLVYVPIQEPS